MTAGYMVTSTRNYLCTNAQYHIQMHNTIYICTIPYTYAQYHIHKLCTIPYTYAQYHIHMHNTIYKCTIPYTYAQYHVAYHSSKRYQNTPRQHNTTHMHACERIQIPISSQVSAVVRLRLWKYSVTNVTNSGKLIQLEPSALYSRWLVQRKPSICTIFMRKALTCRMHVW